MDCIAARIPLVLFFTVFLLGCAQAPKEKKCVDGATVNRDVCTAVCESMDTRSTCERASNDLGTMPYTDLIHFCHWTELTETTLKDDGTCEFGDTVGRCDYAVAGEGWEDFWAPICDSGVFREHEIFSVERDDQTYLSLTYHGYGEGETLYCDQRSSDYSPFCQCACQEDSPWTDDTPEQCLNYEEMNYGTCEHCTQGGECNYLWQDCDSPSGCLFLHNTVKKECADHAVGSENWLECFSRLPSRSEHSLNRYKKLFVCQYCHACAQFYEDAKPACDLWKSDFSVWPYKN